MNGLDILTNEWCETSPEFRVVIYWVFISLHQQPFNSISDQVFITT